MAQPVEESQKKKKRKKNPEVRRHVIVDTCPSGSCGRSVPVRVPDVVWTWFWTFRRAAVFPRWRRRRFMTSETTVRVEP